MTDMIGIGVNLQKSYKDEYSKCPSCQFSFKIFANIFDFLKSSLIFGSKNIEDYQIEQKISDDLDQAS